MLMGQMELGSGVVAAVADAAFGLDLAHSQQGTLGQCGTHQLIDQNGKQHHIPGQAAIRQCGGRQGHTQSHARLGQQGDAQIVPDGLALAGYDAACGRAVELARGPGQDIEDAHGDGHGIYDFCVE